MKINSEDLARMYREMRTATVLRDGNARIKIIVHMGSCGIAVGSREIARAFLTHIENDRPEDVVLTTTGCSGSCADEPMASVEVDGEPTVRYGKLDEAKVERIYDEHIKGGHPVAEYIAAGGDE